ncbi:carboxypeptidase regulatory-like domain-containing protein [bacterium]|nr:carboxypeptidase regulatory-like domain-containing protein [bacterium]
MRRVGMAILAISLFGLAALALATEDQTYQAGKEAYYQAVSDLQAGLELTPDQIQLLKQAGYGGQSAAVIDHLGGPDQRGYIFIDSDEPDGPTYDWLDITASGTEVSDSYDIGDDDYIGPFDIGFNFPFYGGDRSQVWIHSNGVISFDDWGDDANFTNEELPGSSTDLEGACICFFWDDLDPELGGEFDGGQIYYETMTYQNQDVFVVSFHDVMHYPGASTSPTMTCQVILFEDGAIRMQYNSFDAGFELNDDAETIGIVNDDLTIYLEASLYNVPLDYPSAGLALDFYQLDSNASMNGTVTDANTGDPIVGAELVFGSVSTLSGTNGEYTMTGLYAGPGFVTLTATGYFQLEQQVNLSEGPNQVDFEMDPLPPPQTTDYFTDFEDDPGFLFTEGTTTNTWVWGEPTLDPDQAYSGTYAWDLALNSTYENNIDEWLFTATSWLVSDAEAYISYWHWFSFEACCDGYNLQISTDGGETWDVLYPDQGYTDDDGVYANDYQSCFNNNGDRDEQWEYVSYSLAQYVGQPVWFGWRAVSDPSIRYAGVCLDDLEIHVGAGGPNATLDLISQSGDIPPSGGTVVYDASLVSGYGVTVPNLDFWTWVRTPSNELVGPLSQITFTHQPFMNVTVTGRTLDVPAYAPGGEYTFSGAVGNFPDVIRLQDSFTFFKTGTATVPQPADPWNPLHWRSSEFAWDVADTEAKTTWLPSEFALGTPYPNPFNPTTSVSVSLPESSQLTVNVYNLMGQKVAQLAHGHYPAGVHQFTLDGRLLSSGLYFIQADVPGHMSRMQKVTLMK